MVFTELEKKERQREASRKSYHKNKEKNKERYRESSHKYYHENKEKNKEKNKESSHKYYCENKEKEAQRKKAYYQTERGIKSYRIDKWKRRGVICENFDNLYDYVINCKNCENCDIELTVDRHNTATTRCLDHCHETGEFRDVLCHSCNIRRR